MGEDRGGGDSSHPPLSPLPSREGKIKEEDYEKGDVAIPKILSGISITNHQSPVTDLEDGSVFAS
jgi:hypothetical protein